MNPVSPGDPILPRMTAQWYNSTLKSVRKEGRGKGKNAIPREGELYCYVDAAVTRFQPAGIIDIIDEPGKERIPVLGTPITDVNWVIPQESGGEGSVVLAVIAGPTRAEVTINNASDRCVSFYSGSLETTREGKAQLLDPGDGGLALINIGVQVNCIELVGRVASGLDGSCDAVVVGSLRGVNTFAPSGSISAHNIFRFTSDPDSLVWCKWVHQSARWEIVQAACPGTEACTTPVEYL